MKDTQKSVLVNVFIIFGLLLFFIVAVFAYWTSDKAILKVLSVLFLCLQFIFGFMISLLALKRTHKATHLFTGSLLSVWAVLYFLVDNVFVYGIGEFWPLFGVFAGLLLFVSGFYKYHKVKFGYFIPAITLVGMGVWYSFFSLGVIKTPFLEVVKRLGPAFGLLLVLFLIALFIMQKRTKKFVISDEETGTFSDENEDIVKHVE